MLKKLYNLLINLVLNIKFMAKKLILSDWMNKQIDSRIGKMVKLYGKISTNGIFTLNDNVKNYTFIIISTTVNGYDHYQYMNMYNYNINGLYSYRSQRLLCIDNNGNITAPGYFHMYDDKIDTNGLTEISSKKIISIYGIK